MSVRVEQRVAAEFVRTHPAEAARILDRAPADEAAELLAELSPAEAAALLQRVSPPTAEAILRRLSEETAARILEATSPPEAAALLARLDERRREAILEAARPREARELRLLLEYPENTAGRLMDPRIFAFHRATTVQNAVARLREQPPDYRIQGLYVIDDDGRLVGVARLQDVLLADGDRTLAELADERLTAVSALATREEIVETMEQHRLASVPVIDIEGKPLGVIRLDRLMRAVEEEASLDLVAMVGAGKEERALSSPILAVRKRLPWLQINLATAFLAASVVGLFEETIAKYTALAVLLPVVAGQSGNTGAQALAVTLRGLALRELTVSQWPKLLIKELIAGAANGLAVAAVTCLGVFFWSGSTGLTLVIGLAMVVSMAIAAVAGAAIPVLLTVFGQDPAQSSSIVLTTVTDIFGFFSFLGLATAFSSML